MLFRGYSPQGKHSVILFQPVFCPVGFHPKHTKIFQSDIWQVWLFHFLSDKSKRMPADSLYLSIVQVRVLFFDLFLELFYQLSWAATHNSVVCDCAISTSCFSFSISTGIVSSCFFFFGTATRFFATDSIWNVVAVNSSHL